MRKTLLGVIGLCVAGGCGGHPAPNEQIANSLAAVRGAEEAGAMNVPEAALHVKLAQEQIEQAKQLMNHDENLKAEDRALRADLDAELALAIAREDTARKKLDQLEQAQRTAGGEHP